MKTLITKRQKELLWVIYHHIKDTGYPPTFEEMRENLNVSSNQSIVDLLAKLKNGGYIKKDEGARRLAVLPLGYEVLGEPSLAAFLGATSAGAPIEAIEIPGEWEIMPGNVAKSKHEVSLLKVSGDSMMNAGIDDGDVVLVQSQKEFSSGNVVLARIGDESTIKRFISEDKPPYVYLKPENPKYEVVYFTEETRLVGRVISVLKSGYWKPIK